MTDDTAAPVAARVPTVPASGPQTALADDVTGEAPRDRWGASSPAAAVLAATDRHWNTSGPLPEPAGDWLACPVCRGPWLIRLWRFHTRPGAPTVPWRCDVHLKCRECAHGWWHGVALSEAAWERRPRPYGLRALLTRGSNFEPAIFSGVR